MTIRTVALACFAVSLVGCVHTLPEPVVTNIAYDEKGVLIVTKCPVHWTNYLFVAVTSVEMTPHLSTDYRPTECHYDHLRPEAVAGAPPVAPASSAP